MEDVFIELKISTMYSTIHHSKMIQHEGANQI